MRIEVATAAQTRAAQRALVDLLVENVNTGASLGWLPPMPRPAAEAFWSERVAAVEAGRCVLLIAWVGDRVAGSAQLRLEQFPNGTHRAEVQKLMVHPGYRRRGIATQLMHTLHERARQAGRTLLLLDTRQGDPAESLYRKLGYEQVGVIPNYVRNPDGSLVPTVVYTKIL